MGGVRGLLIVGISTGLGLAGAGCGTLVFGCDEDGDCTLLAGGVCQPAYGCSYPDPACDSGLRYSDHARERAGECVPVEAADDTTVTTTAPSTMTATGSTGSTGPGVTTDAPSTGDETTGPPPTECTGIDCSGAGECVLLDGLAYCLCDPGYYRVGPECLEDPCDSATCYFVANDGDNDNPGTREEPWETLGRVDDGELEPGDVVLLKRGDEWLDPYSINGAEGTAEAYITYGAYGPFVDGPPRVGSWNIQKSHYIVVRDQAAYEPMPNNAAVISQSDNVIFRDNVIRNPQTRAFRIDEGSNHLVVMGNRLQGTHADGVVWISDVNFDSPPTTVGDHHWVIDNLVFDPSFADNGRGIVASGVSLEDVKIVGNRVSQASIGVDVEVERAAWVIGNTGADASSRVIDIETPQDGVQVTGNVAFGGERALQLNGSLTPEIAHNTFVQEAPSELVAFASAANPMVFVDNLLASGESPLLLIPAGAIDDVVELDRNWYVPIPGDDCIIADAGVDVPWSDWAIAAMLDGASTCAEGPITATPALVGTADEWDADFLQAFVPPDTWERCGDPAGAYDCDGNRLGLELRPIPSYADNEGRGWEGPLEVRLRYRFTE